MKHITAALVVAASALAIAQPAIVTAAPKPTPPARVRQPLTDG